MIIEIRAIIVIPNQNAGDYSAAIENITNAIVGEFPGWKPSGAFSPIRVTIKGLEIPVTPKEENGK